MKILILDDHSLFSQGLGGIIKRNYKDFHCDFYTNISSLKKKNVDFNALDLIISDIEIPGENIFEFLTELKENYPKVPILIVSMHNKLSIIRKCKELEIQGYILKDDYELVLIAIEQILSGQDYYSSKVLETLSILDEKEKLLTPREEKIIHLIARAKNNHEIAEKLFISYNTVKTHRKNINRKLGLSKTCEIVDYYKENYI